jgi:hypothetical protein
MSLKIDVLELKTPFLEFGDDKDTYLDPRLGLSNAGPFSLRFGPSHKSEVRLALIGTDEMIAAGSHWFSRCQKPIRSGREAPLYVDFPGFRNAFQSKLALSKSWNVNISRDLQVALSKKGTERFEAVLDVYTAAIKRATAMDRIDVAVCCLPHEVVSTCGTVSRSLTPAERKAVRLRHTREDSAQLSFLSAWGDETDPEELLQRDFRRALKARAMEFRIPTQIATAALFDDESANQDPATRAWNSSVALFYKAGGLPWRVRTEGPETCFLGLSFHHLRTSQRALVYSSVAQAFSTEGDGFALRGDAVPRPPGNRRSIHLDKSQASELGGKVLAEYRERAGRYPTRVVLHKTTYFDDEERMGFQTAFNQIPIVEFVAIAPSDFRLVQRTAYPPKRGTLCRINEYANFLFTTGFVPEWNTYPGAHVPVPVRVRTDQRSDLTRIATEILGLARMNWNTAFDTTGAPITLRFAQQVGGIMAELLDRQPEPSYRFYM